MRHLVLINHCDLYFFLRQPLLSAFGKPTLIKFSFLHPLLLPAIYYYFVTMEEKKSNSNQAKQGREKLLKGKIDWRHSMKNC